jgi:hypothetical protein
MGQVANSYYQIPPVSTRMETLNKPSGQCRGQILPRRRRNQQHCAAYRTAVVVDNVRRLADSCNQIRNLCKDGVFKKTEHSTIMEYLGKRKEGRQVLEEWEVTWRGDGGNHCGTEQSGGGEGQ